MNQHSVQKAYLKSFADKSGKVWNYVKAGGRPIPKPPGECAAEKDFQSRELERYQSRVIETPGIRALRISGSLCQREYEEMSTWMALHMLRTQKGREQLFQSEAGFEERFHEELRNEQVFSDYYKFAYTYDVLEPHFLVTSDDPVIEFTCADFLIRACALSPQKLIFFSPRAGKFDHELSVHDFFNAMMLGAPGDHLYSHRSDLRVDDLKEFARIYNLRGVIEDMRFEVRSGGEPA